MAPNALCARKGSDISVQYSYRIIKNRKNVSILQIYLNTLTSVPFLKIYYVLTYSCLESLSLKLKKIYSMPPRRNKVQKF